MLGYLGHILLDDGVRGIAQCACNAVSGREHIALRAEHLCRRSRLRGGLAHGCFVRTESVGACGADRLALSIAALGDGGANGFVCASGVRGVVFRNGLCDCGGNLLHALGGALGLAVGAADAAVGIGRLDNGGLVLHLEFNGLDSRVTNGLGAAILVYGTLGGGGGLDCLGGGIYRRAR